jgi:hypothetical protein
LIIPAAARRITGMRHFRQALASPYPGARSFTIRCADHGTRPAPPRRAPHAVRTLEIRMRTASRVTAICVLTAVLVAGCGARGVKVADLRQQPHRYDDRTISLTGVVTGSWGVPVLLQVYNIDDGTGEISIVSRGGTVPPRGARVQVRGRVGEIAAIGGRSIGLHVQEEQRRFR